MSLKKETGIPGATEAEAYDGIRNRLKSLFRRFLKFFKASRSERLHPDTENNSKSPIFLCLFKDRLTRQLIFCISIGTAGSMEWAAEEPLILRKQ